MAETDVLLLEDEDEDQVEVVERAGYRSVGFADAAEGWARLLELQPKVIPDLLT